MRIAAHPWKIAIVALALALPTLSCKGFMRTFAPDPHPPMAPNAALDQTPPLHTGGLDVLGSTPQGQGPGPSPASHGSLAAGGIATGVGVIVLGAVATKTAMKCTAPDASAACLRGPGPADSVSDAGEP